jgi:hydrogenase expression/formation protein HypE
MSDCARPHADDARILLGHGSGGALTHRLIESVFRPRFSNPRLDEGHDGAVIDVGGRRAAFTTDSFVVKPLFFPGGDIGKLAVHGTINDLAMCGARPLCLSAGFILEEGLPRETLERVAHSMSEACRAAGVELVTGDTKVVDRGKADGLFINTSGIGLVESPAHISPKAVRPGDVVLVNGDIGRHGMAVMSAREGLEFESPIESDTAPLAAPVLDLLAAGVEVHCLRDATRGGLAGVLVEIARAAKRSLLIQESAIPVTEAVRGACEIFGLEALYVANEGRFAAFVAEADAERALSILRRHESCADARVIGRVLDDERGLVTLKSAIGVGRLLDMLAGEQLPRIC